LTSIDERLLLTQLLDLDSEYLKMLLVHNLSNCIKIFDHMPALIAAGDVLPPEPVQTRTRVVILVHPKDLSRVHEKGMIGSNDEAPIAQSMRV